MGEDMYIKHLLKMSDEEAAAKKGGDAEPESVKMSCTIKKINKYGFN